jgi:hypothetical protein
LFAEEHFSDTVWCFGGRPAATYKELAERQRNMKFHVGVPEFANFEGDSKLVILMIC